MRNIKEGERFIHAIPGKMAQLTIISVAALISVCLLSNVSCQRRRGSRCTESIQCATNYCRDGRCINFGDVPDDVGDNPCYLVDCRESTVCVLEQVQCIQFPCPPQAACVKPRRRPC